eukprot:CAMPEP_0179492954 /NCGR_PEP_ID=MMETSP0799-20121207/67123_1 /TAXON_ID=46947 /ORGANISM="Geminigera cryophila, Strain CCMP2564" /LENGTH=78 /DNA_ID=CAMNT_0021309959 /DNA_START=76 /DNA_END=309 /DNA_ORIENTATION=+
MNNDDCECTSDMEGNLENGVTTSSSKRQRISTPLPNSAKKTSKTKGSPKNNSKQEVFVIPSSDDEAENISKDSTKATT